MTITRLFSAQKFPTRCFSTAYIISKSGTEAQGDQTEQKPVGTGPYRFLSWQRDGNLYGVARNLIWKAKPGESVLAYEMKIR